MEKIKKPFFSKILELFKENNGNYSAMRIITIMWMIVILILWWQNPKIEMNNSILELVGILIGGKTIQKFAENLGNNNDIPIEIPQLTKPTSNPLI